MRARSKQYHRCDDILQDIHVLRLPDPPLTVRRLDRRLMAIAPILGRYAW